MKRTNQEVDEILKIKESKEYIRNVFMGKIVIPENLGRKSFESTAKNINEYVPDLVNSKWTPEVNGKYLEKNLTVKAKEFIKWIDQLKQVAADKLNIEPSEVKINEEEAFKYYNDGFTPTQCFREAW